MDKETRIEDSKVIGAALALVAFCVLLSFATGAWAAPVYRTQVENITITLYDDKKACPHAVNLPRKAVWRENNKDIEGCWALNQIGVIMFWFEDKTVASVPAQQFTRVSES